MPSRSPPRSREASSPQPYAASTWNRAPCRAAIPAISGALIWSASNPDRIFTVTVACAATANPCVFPSAFHAGSSGMRAASNASKMHRRKEFWHFRRLRNTVKVSSFRRYSFLSQGTVAQGSQFHDRFKIRHRVKYLSFGKSPFIYGPGLSFVSNQLPSAALPKAVARLSALSRPTAFQKSNDSVPFDGKSHHGSDRPLALRLSAGSS